MVQEQLRAIWNSRGKDQSFVKGLLLTKTPSINHCIDDSNSSNLQLNEKWFTLIEHSLFYCKHREGPDYSGALLTDIFSPVIARVSQKVLDAFELPEEEQPYALYLKGCLVDVEVLICPQSMEEKRIWLESFQQAGLNVPARKASRRLSRGKDGREKVVVVNGSINDSLYTSPTHKTGPPSLKKNLWAQQWKKAAQKVLSLPDASQIRIKFDFLQRFYESESRYLKDLSTLVELYHRQLKIAVDSGHVLLRRDQLDAIFLNCESLLMLHKMFCSQLKKTLSQPSVRIGELLLAFMPHMEVYAEFIRNHDKSTKVLEDCLQNSSLAGFLENHHPSHDCEAHQLKMLLHQPVTRLEIYQAFVEKVLEQTSEEHVDYKLLGQALEGLQDLKNVLAKASSLGENQDRILNIIETVGTRGFLLLEPDCKLILEDEMYLPATSKWVTGTIRRRPVHCYLYSNAFVVISTDKKSNKRSQVFPLCGATVYEHVSHSGEVTHSKNSDLEIRALKIYSPNGPRNGVVIIFLLQSSKNLWLSKISETIALCTPDPIFPSSPSPPLHHSTSVSHITPPHSPNQNQNGVQKGRRVSVSAIQSGGSGSQSSSHAHNGHSSLSSSCKLEDGACVRDSPILISRTTSLLGFEAESKQSSPEMKPKSQYLPISTLFSQLISSPPDPHYPNTFLLTYRMFTNAHEVLDALLEGHRKELHIRAATNKMNSTISMESLRFFNILKLWVNKYYVDFHHDVTLKKVLVEYLNSVRERDSIQDKEMELADGLLKTVNKRDHIPLIRRSKLRIQIPKAVNPVPEELSSIPPDVLAQQLTWIEHELYSRIKPYEFLQQKWTKKNRLELAPNICHVITRFNQMTEWISKVALSPDQPRQRCAMITMWVQVAQHALELNNFVSVFQITAALYSTAIQRLRKTWDLMPQSVIDQFEELRKLTSIEGGSKVYRKKQNNSPSPSVPYIGPYLNQLISVEVGMSTFVKDPPEHVNLSKLSRLAKVIEELMKFQNPSYSFNPDGAIMVFVEKELESSHEFDEDQRYSRSIELEPRK